MKVSISLEVCWQGEVKGHDVEEFHEVFIEADCSWPEGEDFGPPVNVQVTCHQCEDRDSEHCWDDLSSAEKQTAEDMMAEQYEEDMAELRPTLKRQLMWAIENAGDSAALSKAGDALLEALSDFNAAALQDKRGAA